MKDKRPEILENAPLQYAPENELGVVFLFSHIAKKLRIKVESIRPQFPDCIAYQKTSHGELRKCKAVWRKGDCYAGPIKRISKIDSPIFLEDLRQHRILKTSSFVRRNMQGNLNATEYWPYLFEMIVQRNPGVKNKLKKYAPERL